MLARRSLQVNARGLTNAAFLTSSFLRSASSQTTSLQHYHNQRARSLVCLPSSHHSSLTCPRRCFVGQTVMQNLAIHSTQLTACTQLSTMLYSPLGTTMLLVLAYNVVVVLSKYVNYIFELTAKDYVQDQQLYVIMRYGILACILLGMEVMFIEV